MTELKVAPKATSQTTQGNPFLDEVGKLTNGESKFSYVQKWPKCCGKFQLNVYAGESSDPKAKPDNRSPLLSSEMVAPCCDDYYYPLSNTQKQLVFQPKWPNGCGKCCEHPVIQNGQAQTVATVRCATCCQKVKGKCCPCLGKIYFRACDAEGNDRFTLRKFGCCKNPQNDKCCDFETDVECEGCDECMEYAGTLTDCFGGVIDEIPGLKNCLSICKTIKCKDCKDIASGNLCKCGDFYRRVLVFGPEQTNIVPVASIEFKGFFTFCKGALKPNYQVIINPPKNASYNDTAALMLLALELDRMTVFPMVGRSAE